MDFSRVQYYLKKYNAVSLKQEDFKDGYLEWALGFFTNPNMVTDPYLDLTLQLDITQARENYKKHYKCNDSTLTAFLTWKLLTTLKRHTHFLWRYIKGTWYEIENPPLFFPVAVGHNRRFHEVLIENVFRMSWKEFVPKYKMGLDAAFSGIRADADREVIFQLSQFIGNLPNLNFSGLKLHSGRNITNAFFYFGKRTYLEPFQRWNLPLAIKFHHSNADPYVVDLLMQDFMEELMR
jgi:chloramphenicol O-acetyltransferase type A